MVIVKKSNIHGKGVFATKRIKKGTILECDVLEVGITEHVRDYMFPFIGGRVCLHIGFASFLNRSKKPNLKHLRIDPVEKISYFEVLTQIEKQEEITMYY
jgi:SET domain-containing protein